MQTSHKTDTQEILAEKNWLFIIMILEYIFLGPYFYPMRFKDSVFSTPHPTVNSQITRGHTRDQQIDALQMIKACFHFQFIRQP